MKLYDICPELSARRRLQWCSLIDGDRYIDVMWRKRNDLQDRRNQERRKDFARRSRAVEKWEVVE